MAGPDRPPEQLIREWLESHGPVTVSMAAIEQTWELEEMSARDRRRVARALERAGVVVEPPLRRAGPRDELALSLRQEDAPEPVAGPADEAPAEPSSEPRTSRLGLVAVAVGLMVIGSLGPWAKDVFVTDYGLDRDGALVIAAAGLAALMLALHARRSRRAALPIAAAALGAAAIGVLASEFRDVVDDTFVEPAWGLYAAGAGAVLLVALSMSLLVRRG